MRKLIIVDDFYPDPDAIRRKAMKFEFQEPEGITGWRSVGGYYPRNIKKRLENYTGAKVSQFPQPLGDLYDNGIFYLSFAKGNKSEKPGVHYDDPLHHMVCIVYLTKGIPEECGTSFFKHKRTGMIAKPNVRDARRLRTNVDRLEDEIHFDSNVARKWIEVDRVGYRYNRAVIFPAKRFHAASKHFGGNIRGGRIYQLYTFKATW
ncbi:MAG: hypothetical protein HKN22_06330 [Bacteroidia bacterium]|nr:hypothetical protein [Bacteroidia bacterium]